MSIDLDLSHIEPTATVMVPAGYVLYPIVGEQDDGSRILNYVLIAVPSDDELEAVARKVIVGGGRITPDLETGYYQLDITNVQSQLTPRDREVLSYAQRDEEACAAFGEYATQAHAFSN